MPNLQRCVTKDLPRPEVLDDFNAVKLIIRRDFGPQVAGARAWDTPIV